MIETRWKDEEAWWLLGEAEARRRTHPAALMVLDGAGILQGEAIFAALSGRPRWSSVVMTERSATEGEDCTVLAYRLRAARVGGGADYLALCSSTWVRQAEGWRLIQHQQSAPAAKDAA